MKDKKPYKCNTCGCRFGSPQSINSHITSAHRPVAQPSSSFQPKGKQSQPKLTRYSTCRFCTDVFSAPKGLSIHISKTDACREKYEELAAQRARNADTGVPASGPNEPDEQVHAISPVEEYESDMMVSNCCFYLWDITYC
jgi:hypothetical protein